MSDAAPTPTLQVDVTDVRGYPDTLAADLDRANADAADRCALDVDTDRHWVTVTAEDATAARWLYEWLEEIVDALAGDSTLGDRSWWERAVRPGLGRLAEYDLVEYTRNRGWRWIGHLDREDSRNDRR